MWNLSQEIARLLIDFSKVYPLEALFLYMYVFWVLFLACAGIYAGWKKAPLWVRVALSPVGVVAGLVDVFFEFTFANVLFLGWPPTKTNGQICWTLTQRISWYKDNVPDTWRGKLGRFICSQMLDPFQVGGHCSSKS